MGLKKLPLPSSGAATPPKTGLAAPSPAAANMTAQEMVAVAKQVRSFGDMQGALETLNLAELRFPNDPSVLAETAQCYEQMELLDKASAIWRRLKALGPEKSAGHYDLAVRRLEGGAATAGAASALASRAAEGGKVLGLGACQAARDQDVVNGEKVVLRIPVVRHGPGAVDPNQVDIDVFFFDRVNGQTVEPTIADDPVTNWLSVPVDWSGVGEEALTVTYFLPPLTPGEVQVHGRRAYHGYLVRLYYQHKLQDVAAEPRDLLSYGSGEPQATASMGNPLLPPVSQ